MLHEPAQQTEKDYGTQFKMRLGAWLFLVYALIYAGFVAINLVKPTLMETVIVLGLNLAVIYGIGLIVVALVMALIYDRICAARESELRALDREGEAR